MALRSVLVSFLLATSALAKCSDDGSLVASTGDPKGKEEVHDGVTLYITTPSDQDKERHGGKSDKAVLYLTDVFGIQLLENKLLADSFARAGYVTVAPDLFDGKPAPADLNDPNFNQTAFLAAHGPNATDPIIQKGLNYLRNTLGFKRVAATGYCFGGRYSFRLADSKDVTAAFAAHPSLWEDAEALDIQVPVSVAAAENDSLMSPTKRASLEALLQNSTQGYQVSLYSGTSHGFGVRANVSDPWQKYGKETAFAQAVRWFDTWA